jgi:hypothetical protein
MLSIQAERPNQEVNGDAIGGCTAALSRGVGANRVSISTIDEAFVPAIVACYLSVVPAPLPEPEITPFMVVCAQILAEGNVTTASEHWASFMAQCVPVLERGGSFRITVPAHVTPS